MKIAIITDCIDDGAAGVGVYTKMLAENLLKLDKQNEYVLVHYKKGSNDFYKNKKELVIKMRSLPFFREFRKIFIMPKFLEKEGFDLVHEPMQLGPFFFRKKYRAVVTIHDLSPLVFPKTFNWTIPIHHLLGLNMTLPVVNRIITDSKSTRKDVVTRFPVASDKIRVIHLGVSDSFSKRQKSEVKAFRKKYRLDFPFILYLGTLEPRKNIVTLISAYASLKNKISHKLVIGGAKGWKFSHIFKKVQESGLEQDIIFLGFVPDKDLALLYSSADLFVFPSLYEGFGLPPLEAMKCGCPVVVSNSSSLPEVVGDAALTVDPHDVSGLADAIYKILSSVKLRRDLVRKGFLNVKHFSWKRCAKETLKVYKEACE